jgi:feruloyl esterase
MEHVRLLPRGAIIATALIGFSAGAAAQTTPSAEQLKGACPTLNGQSIPSSSIGLPSGNASITSATFVAAAPRSTSGSTVNPEAPDYCKVLGTIAPLDPQAQLINFQINLPLVWNSKAVQYGGGGYNGTLVTGLTPLQDAVPDDLTPLMREYVTLGTDSGHQASSFAPDSIGQFGLNDEMLINYGYASYKKVRDVAVAVMRSFYLREPSKFYYSGGSEGGREGLTMAQRFPADYDGIVSVVPVVQLSMLFQSYLPHQIPQVKGGWMSPAKVQTFGKFVASSCDALDGISDGIISNYLACPKRINLQALRCEGGADTGESCLSDAQLTTLSEVYAPTTFNFPLANGLTTYPPSLYGNETTPDPANPTMTRWVTGTAPPMLPVDPSKASQQWLYGVNFVKFFVTRNPDFDPLTYNPDDHKARLQQVSEIIDSTNPDLSAFFAQGGKLIMRENMADLAQSPLAGINYFSAMTAKVGQDVVKQSARLYVSPGSNHSGPAASVTTGSAVPTTVDLLDPLDRWATTGQAPPDVLVQTLKATAAPFAVQAERPMCQYPDYPHYTQGDPRAASSYTCTLSQP